MKRYASILCSSLVLSIACRFESGGLAHSVSDDTVELGGSNSVQNSTSGSSNISTEAGGKNIAQGGSSSHGGSMTEGGMTASETTNVLGGETSSGGTRPSGGSISTGGTHSGGSANSSACPAIILNTKRVRINASSSVYSKTFDVSCNFEQATLSVQFDGTSGPNRETPPTITVSNNQHVQTVGVASFMPPLSNDPCWILKSDDSHDYACPFLVTEDVSDALIQGANTISISGKSGDTFSITDISLAF